MINAPQSVRDALSSGDFSYANLIKINLGDVYGNDSDFILYLTDYGHNISHNGQVYTTDNNLTEIEGISRKASTGSDSVDIVFSVTDEDIINAIKTTRYANKASSIDRAIINQGSVLDDYLIPVRTAWGLSHAFSGSGSDRIVTLTIDSTLGNLDGDNGWFAINSSHMQRYPNDLIMRHSYTVMTEDQQKKYTTNFNGVINQDIKPPALNKIYGYRNAELIPICMLKHRKTHSSYRHYFTTMIYAINIGECDHIEIGSLRKNDEAFDFRIVNDNSRDVGGWSVRVRTPSDADLGDLLSEENSGDLSFWFEGMDAAEKNRMIGMSGKGLTLLFIKNRNRDGWLSSPPALTLPIRGSKVYDPRLGAYYPPDFVGPIETPTTVFSRNPALQYADYLRSTQYGAGSRGVEHPTNANIIELADHFDSIPDSEGNQGINSILMDIQVDTGQPVTDNLNIWIDGARLYTSDYYGEFNVRVETKGAIDWSIDESELLEVPEYESGEFTDRINQLTYSVKQLIDDNENGGLIEVEVEATYPESGSQIHLDWIDEDGGINNFKSERLSYVTVLEQSYYWAMVDARISRQPRKMEITTNPLGWLSEVGDIISFDSIIMNETNELWRVQEVAEDDNEVSLSLIAYDDNFYTPDPNAIPDPISNAQPPTKTKLTAVSGLSIIEKSGFYYVDWEPISNANLSWYSVFITLDPETPEAPEDDIIVFDNPKVAQPPVLLESIKVGNYNVEVVAIGHDDEGAEASLSFTIALPETPAINITVGNFSVEVYPSVTTAYLGSSFELKISDVNDILSGQDKGSSGAFTVANLTPDKEYFIWVRTVNVVGQSEWATTSFTTLNDNSEFVDFIDLDRESIIDDAVNEMQGVIDGIVDGNQAQEVINLVNNIWDSVENTEDVITEENIRKSETSQLVGEIELSNADIRKLEQITVDNKSASAIQFESINLSVNDNTSEISRIDQAYVDGDNALALSVTQLTANVNNNYATITYTDQAISNEASARATAISQLESDVAGTYATTISVSDVQSDVDGNASAITGLTTRVETTEGDISDANLILGTHTTDIGGLASRAFLGTTTVSGETERVTGIYIQDGTNLQSVIEFQTDSLQLTNTNGDVKFYWDDTNSEFVFDGTLKAASGTFAGDLSAAGGTFAGTVYAENIEGDVTDSIVKTTTERDWDGANDPSRIASIATVNVTAMPFDRVITCGVVNFDSIGSSEHPWFIISGTAIATDSEVQTHVATTDAGVRGFYTLMSPSAVIPANSSGTVVFSVGMKLSFAQYYHHSSQPLLIQCFKSGGTLS